MKNWKDKVLGIFAVIGIMTLLMGNYAQAPKGVWEFHTESRIGGGTTAPAIMAWSINTETGEVRKHETIYINVGGKDNRTFGAYRKTTPY